MTDIKMTEINTTELDFGIPSLRAIGEAITVEDFRLPDGWRIHTFDYSDCSRPGARTGEIIFEGDGPRRETDRWIDEDGVEQIETEPTTWGFRVRIDQIGE